MHAWKEYSFILLKRTLHLVFNLVPGLQTSVNVKFYTDPNRLVTVYIKKFAIREL